MSDFDPSQPAILHDRLTDAIIPWTGERQDDWRQSAVYEPNGAVNWDGCLFDGWGNVLGG